MPGVYCERASFTKAMAQVAARDDQNRDQQHPPPRDEAVHRNPLDPLAFR